MKGFFAIAALAVAASAHYLPANHTTSTVTVHVTDTIINCATTVTDCPAHSTITTVYDTTYTTVCPITQSHPAPSTLPAPPVSTPVTPVGPSSSGYSSKPIYPTTSVPYTITTPAGTAPAPTGTGAYHTTPSAPISTGAASKMGAAFGVVFAAAAVMAL